MDFQKVYIKILFFLLLTFTRTNTSAINYLLQRGVQKFFGSNGILNYRTHEDIKIVPRDDTPSPIKGETSNITYMEKVPDYPEKMVKEVLMKEGERHKDFFGKESKWEVPEYRSYHGSRTKGVDRKKPAVVQQSSVGASFFSKFKGEKKNNKDVSLPEGFLMGRIGPGENPDEERLCPALIQTIYPKQAENKNGKWRYVVNLGGEYTQGVIVETCVQTDKCKFHNAFPSIYTSTCEQRYVYKRLLAVTDSGATVVDEFKMPSCCMCVIRRVSVS